MAFGNNYPIDLTYPRVLFNQLQRIGPDYSLQDNALRNVTYISNEDDKEILDLKNSTGDIEFKGLTYIPSLGVGNLDAKCYFDVQPTTISTSSYTRPFPVLTRAQRKLLTGQPTGSFSFETDTYPTSPSIPGWNMYYTEQTGIPRALRDPNETYVTDLTDLADLVSGGHIYLKPWTSYVFKSGVSLYVGSPVQDMNIYVADRSWLYNPRIFIWGSIVYRGDGTVNVGNINYMKTTGDLITAESAYLHSSDVIRFYQCQIYGVYSGCQLFNLQVADPTVIFILQDTVLAGNPAIPNQVMKCGNANTIGLIFNTVRHYYYSNGWTMQNQVAGATLSRLEFKYSRNLPSPNCIDIDISGIAGSFDMDFIFARPKSNDYIFNIHPSAFGAITLSNSPIDLSESGVTKANIFYPASYDSKTINIKMIGNTYIRDSSISSIAYFYNGVLTTTIDAQYQLVKPLDGVAWITEELERMTAADGYLVYVGRESDVLLKGNCLISLDPVLPVTKYLTARWIKLIALKYSFTVDIVLNQILYVNHGLVNGDTVYFSTTSTIPAPLRLDTVYYVVGSSTNYFSISLTLGGAAIDITNVGVPPYYFQKCLVLAGVGENRIVGGTPGTVNTSCVVSMNNNDSLFVVISNMDDAVDVIARSIYHTVFK